MESESRKGVENGDFESPIEAEASIDPAAASHVEVSEALNESESLQKLAHARDICEQIQDRHRAGAIQIEIIQEYLAQDEWGSADEIIKQMEDPRSKFWALVHLGAYLKDAGFEKRARESFAEARAITEVDPELNREPFGLQHHSRLRPIKRRQNKESAQSFNERLKLEALMTLIKAGDLEDVDRVEKIVDSTKEGKNTEFVHYLELFDASGDAKFLDKAAQCLENMIKARNPYQDMRLEAEIQAAAEALAQRGASQFKDALIAEGKFQKNPGEVKISNHWGRGEGSVWAEGAVKYLTSVPEVTEEAARQYLEDAKRLERLEDYEAKDTSLQSAALTYVRLAHQLRRKT